MNDEFWKEKKIGDEGDWWWLCFGDEGNLVMNDELQNSISLLTFSLMEKWLVMKEES